MSMSVLGSQLAALNSANPSAAGFSRSTSRVNEDGVGRGFHHSARHGHSLPDGDATRRPSILYGDARAAAAASSASLREGAVDALRALGDVAAAAGSSAEDGAASSRALWEDAEFVGGRGLLSERNLNDFERGMATARENAEIDKLILRIMDLVMTMTNELPPPSSSSTASESEPGGGADPILSSCLNVVEYLIRHYSIHSRPNTASSLLRTFLPLQIAYPGSYPFSRVLALVDLQSLPLWSFLRPYASRGAPPLGRTALAKQVARDDALASVVANIGKRSMELCLLEGGGGRDGDGDNGDDSIAFSSRRGISALISFSVSVLVEALHTQSTSRDLNITGGVKESTVRLLFPMILSACKCSDGNADDEDRQIFCPEWKEWGRLLASTLAELCPLSSDVGTALCDAIAKGLPSATGGRSPGRKATFREKAEWTASAGGTTSPPVRWLDDSCSAMMALLSVLGATGSEGGDSEDSWENYLPMLPTHKGQGRKIGLVDYLGCELPPSTYRILKSGRAVSLAIGAVVWGMRDRENGGADGDETGVNAVVLGWISPLVASIVMHAFRRLEREACKVLSFAESDAACPSPEEKSRQGRGREDEAVKFKADRDVLLILCLIREPSLSAVWRSNSSALVAAVTVRAITSYEKLYNSSSQHVARDPPTSLILERYTSILNSLSTIDSVMHDQGVAYAINNAVCNFSGGHDPRPKEKEERAYTLARLLGHDLIPNDGAHLKGDVQSRMGGDVTDPGLLLPARVALEGADASLRLNALTRLRSDVERGDDLDEDLGEALMRRLVADEDPEVAAAAGDIVAGQLKVLCQGGVGGEETSSRQSSALAALASDLDSFAEKAFASLVKWTCFGKDEDSWSPAEPLCFEFKKKRKRRRSMIGSPLLSCISICGSVAKLVLQQISIDGAEIDVDDSDSMACWFFALFLSVGAHVNIGSNKEVSETASTQLRMLLHGGASDTVKSLITFHSVSHRVLAHFFGDKRKGSVMVPKTLQKRFLWLALHSYSDLFESVTSKKTDHRKMPLDSVRFALDLTLFEMRAYTKESIKCDSYEKESGFLRCVCERYLSLLQCNIGDEIEKAVVKLASSESYVSFNEIVKPAISSRFCFNTPSSRLAILVRACLHPQSSAEVIRRIHTIIGDLFRDAGVGDPGAAEDSVIPALALLSHPLRDVRAIAIGTLELFQLAKGDGVVCELCSNATDSSSPMRSSLIMDGASALPQLLGHTASSSSSTVNFQSFILNKVKSCALKEDGSLSDVGSLASAIIMSAMERAGEHVFPLLMRWNFAGKELFEVFLEYDKIGELTTSCCWLRDSILSMLKGVMVNEAQARNDGLALLSMRSRSISTPNFDPHEGTFTVLDPYPDDMLQSILDALTKSSAPPLFLTNLIRLVLMRPSWANEVFRKLSSKSRNAVASALLTLLTQDNCELAGSALSGLPIKASDFVRLLAKPNTSHSEIIFITDCIRGKIDALGVAKDISTLSSELFQQLLSLSSVENSSNCEGDLESRDYTRVSILQTLVAVHSNYQGELIKLLEKEKNGPSPKKKHKLSASDVGTPKTISCHAGILVGLVGGNTSVILPLNSGRGRAFSLTLLTCLCEELPSTVVTSLLPALVGLAGAVSGVHDDDYAEKVTDVKALGDALVAIVPTYCAHAHLAHLSLIDLISALLRITAPGSPNEKSRHYLLIRFIDVIKSLPMEENSIAAIASVIACAMALQASNIQQVTASNETESEMWGDDCGSQNRLDFIARTKNSVKVAVALSLIEYVGELTTFFRGASFSESKSSCDKMKVKISEVTALALHGLDEGESIPSVTTASYAALSESQQGSLLSLANDLLQGVYDILSHRGARQAIRESEGENAIVCLHLWDELMQTHTDSLCAHARAANMDDISLSEKRFWDVAPVITGECLHNLQHILPVSHFLASVSSTLADKSVHSYIRKKSLQLLADRVERVRSDSPEASLFLDMVPDLLAQVNRDPAQAVGDEDSLVSIRGAIAMKQNALITIEAFVRCLYPSSDGGKFATNAAAVFLPALASVTAVLNNTASSWIKANEESGTEMLPAVIDANCQLLSSSSLCVSTLVTTLKARCLPQLQSIIEPLAKLLKSVNVLLGKYNDQASMGQLLQLAILKSLLAITETLPQFLTPHLPLIFSSNALPSKALHRRQGEENHSVRVAATQVSASLATKVPPRKLIPVLTSTLTKILRSNDSVDGEESYSIIEVMSKSLEYSQRSELSPLIGKVFNGLVLAYEHHDGSRTLMLQNANKCLTCLVMKLSEAQLRPLYARLREWKGDIKDNINSKVLLARRFAFWSASAKLSKSLRSIFLPCLASVISDMIDELEVSVSLLCQRRKQSDEGKAGGSSVNMVNLPLQPLLQCLEHALKADAHEGGAWTRGDNNQRYTMILNNIGKLLLAQFPPPNNAISDISPKEQAVTNTYRQLVQGVGTTGSVVGCLTALATAAGNEQLWKPLNFAVLEACGHTRSEVRKAGISCLLSIIESIGEEYMVLLPECLPTLSELLEDDEDIATMAKECVRQGEELLGESLEESLR